MSELSITIPPRLSLVDSAMRRLLFSRLSKLKGGQITIDDGQQSLSFGDSEAELHATVTILNPRFYRRFVIGGGLGVSQSLIDGDWTCDDLTSLIRIFIRNLQMADRFDRGLARIRRSIARAEHWLRKNTRRNAKRNISQHYDVGNELYQLFLDETMNYSCGMFENDTATMHEASLAKMERICRKLNLQPGDHLVEIGSGWGGLAIYAAKHFGCRVTTTTISREQYNMALERVREAGLSERITVLLRDYRDLTGQYDKLVSIEMIEAVGHEYFDTFFQKCSELLRPEGMMLLQSIVIKDQRYKEHLRSVDFIRKHIFPGGCLPSVTALQQSASGATDMRLLQLEDIAPHYVRTLQCWRDEFTKRLAEVRELGYSEAFIRMWNYYLCYCEAAFEERQCNNVQMLFAKPNCRFDLASRSAIEHSTSRQIEHAIPQLRDDCWREACV
jgi:cyclopropane-fatty-acyl-phospholipid synthase